MEKEHPLDSEISITQTDVFDVLRTGPLDRVGGEGWFEVPRRSLIDALWERGPSFSGSRRRFHGAELKYVVSNELRQSGELVLNLDPLPRQTLPLVHGQPIMVDFRDPSRIDYYFRLGGVVTP